MLTISKRLEGWDTELTKYIKQRLSVKIFIITFLLLGAACSGTYFFISKLLPTTYSNLINAATEKAAMHLAEQMADFKATPRNSQIKHQVLLGAARI